MNEDTIKHLSLYLSLKQLLKLRLVSKLFIPCIEGKECKPYESNIEHLHKIKHMMLFNLYITSSHNLYGIKSIYKLTIRPYHEFEEDIEYLGLKYLKVVKAKSFSIKSDTIETLVIDKIKSIGSLYLPKLKTLKITKGSFNFKRFFLPALERSIVRHSKTNIDSFSLMDKLGSFSSYNTIYGDTLIDEYNK